MPTTDHNLRRSPKVQVYFPIPIDSPNFVQFERNMSYYWYICIATCAQCQFISVTCLFISFSRNLEREPCNTYTIYIIVLYCYYVPF